MARSKEVTLALVAIVFAAASARADGAAAKADVLFQEGRRAAERGDAAEACRLFSASYRLEPAIGTLLNLGDCSERQSAVQAAYDYFDAARSRMAPTDDRLPILLERLAALDKLSGRIELRLPASAPQGTSVTLDGAPFDVSRTTPFFVAPTKHVILCTAVGHRGSRYELTFESGQARTLEVTPGEELERVLPSPVEPSDGGKTVRTALRVGAFGAFGLSLASLWIGTAAGVVAIERKGVQAANCNDANVCNMQGVEAASSGATWATISTAFVVAGVALAAAGVGLFVWSKNVGGAVVTATLGPGSIGLQGSF